MIVILSIVADFIFGSPDNFPDILDLFNLIIDKERDICRRFLDNRSTVKALGIIFLAINILGSFFICRLVLDLFSFNKYLQVAIAIHMGYMAISSKKLDYEAIRIKMEMKKSTQNARTRLNYFVSRDTQNLSDSGIIKASIESIGKNNCNMVIGPIFYLIFGPEFALTYCMIALFDEKLSHEKDIYDDFAKFNRILLTIVNFIPARLTSIFMILGSFIKYGGKNALRITLRDHGKGDNINSAWPQASIAGLLGIQLGGGAFYNGIYIEKPYIGDDTRPVRAKDIDDSIRIMYNSIASFILVYLVLLILFNSLL